MRTDIFDWIRLPFRKERKSYLLFYRILGFLPRRIEHYQLAMMHRSYESSQKDPSGHRINNERLEFLGDAILDAVVGDIVYRHFQGRSEGFLTNTRSKIVQRETLNRIALELGLDKMFKSSSHFSSHNNYLYGNAFEALFGAIYLDRGYQKCMEFAQRKMLREHIDLDRICIEEMNFKSKFIEWCQKNRFTSSFSLIKETTDESGNPLFLSSAQVNGIELGQGTGYSKKESQQNAAKKAIKAIQSRKKFAERLKELITIREAEEQASREDSTEPEGAQTPWDPIESCASVTAENQEIHKETVQDNPGE